MVEFYNHEVVQNAPSDYVEGCYTPGQILKAWQTSLFAHELLAKDGTLKAQKDMHESTLEKFINASDAIKRSEALPKPIIGVGIMDNIEIGIGREIIAASLALGIESIPVNMRVAQAEDIVKMLG